MPSATWTSATWRPLGQYLGAMDWLGKTTGNHSFSHENHGFSYENHGFSHENHGFSHENHGFSHENHVFSHENHGFSYMKSHGLMFHQHKSLGLK
jgi:hypothetical protein